MCEKEELNILNYLNIRMPVLFRVKLYFSYNLLFDIISFSFVAIDYNE